MAEPYIAYLAPNGDLLLDYDDTLWTFGFAPTARENCTELERGETEGGPALSKLYKALCRKYILEIKEQKSRYHPTEYFAVIYDKDGKPHKVE